MRNLRTACLAFCAISLLTGCEDQLTMDNYQQLEVGMDYAQTEQIFGRPTECEDTMGLRKCVWGDEDRHVTISYIAEKVAFFTSDGIQ